MIVNRRPDADHSFIELVDRYLDRVYRYLCSLTHDEEVARDLAHETFLRLHRPVAAKTEISEAYVFSTARNTALSRWRSDKREAAKRNAWALERRVIVGEGVNLAPTVRDGSSPSLLLERRDLGRALEAALGSLSEEQRTVFLLSEVEGMKYKTIAIVLGVSAGTVASRKFNAVRALRGIMERLGYAVP